MRSSGAAGSAAVLRQIIPSRIWRTASYHWGKELRSLHSCSGQAVPNGQLVRLFQWAILTHWFCYGQNQVVILATWFSTGLEALQVESSAHFDHLIFTEWARRVTDKTEVLKMITPVASLQMKSSYHFDNLILIRLQSSSQSGNLIRQELQIKLRKA